MLPFSIRSCLTFIFFSAPEVLETLDSGEGYTQEVDLWGVGVILYILLCGFPPFYGDDDDEIYDKICEGYFEYPSPYWDNISDDGCSFDWPHIFLTPPSI